MSLKPFPRSLAFVALLVVAAHVCSVVWLGTSPAGSFVGKFPPDFLGPLSSCDVFSRCPESAGLQPVFWTLVGFGTAIWAAADLGWTYYEVVLRHRTAVGLLIRFLFDTHGMFFVMAIFFNQQKKDSRVETEEALDFIQIGILFFLVYFGWYYLPSLTLSQQTAFTREMTIVLWVDVGILFLAVFQWRRARFPSAQAVRWPGALSSDLHLGSHSFGFLPGSTGTPHRHLV